MALRLHLFPDSVVCNCIFIHSWCSGSDVHSKVLARCLVLVLVLVLGLQVLVLVLAPQVLVLVLVLVRPATCYNTDTKCRDRSRKRLLEPAMLGSVICNC